MRRALLVVLLLIVPLQAAALERNELLGLVAMPLAVAAVSDVTGVPAGDLGSFVSVLNRAAVPPTQVIQVVRYAPVALVVEQDPPFVDYVTQQYDYGVTGPRLVSVIEDRYRSYDLEPEFVTLREPATMYVVRDDYVPPVVVARVAEYRPAGYSSYGYQPQAYDTNDLLALAAMPLAVAAVSELAGVPVDQLTGLMASLNAARMPPVQVVEVLRYAPVALVADYGQPRFVPYIQTQVVSGLRGPALIEVIDTRLRSYDIEPRFVVDTRPDRIVYDHDTFFPPVVRTRVAEVRTHPHGGPPGQLKKDLGLQTGAEVVHGTGWDDRDRVRSARAERSERASARRDVPQRRVVDRQREPVRKVRAEKRERDRQRVAEARREPARKVRAEKRERVRTERSVERARPSRASKDRIQRGGGGERTSLKGNRGGGGGARAGGGNGKGNGKGKG